MATITTDKPVNASQLCVELGREPVEVHGPIADGTYRITVDVSEADLQAAVDAHQADEDWTDPDAPEPEASADDDLQTALDGLAAKSAPTVKDLIAVLRGASPGAQATVAARPVRN